MGGTVTTLVALVHELELYDSSFVHLRELSLEQVSAAIECMSVLDAEGIAALPGAQPKRAGVILGRRGDSRSCAPVATMRSP